MMIFVTPQDTDNRFVIYLKTNTCKVQYGPEGLQFQAALPRINIMKDFFINYGIKQVEVRENGQDAILLMHDKAVFMQMEDLDNISGMKVPILTVI